MLEATNQGKGSKANSTATAVNTVLSIAFPERSDLFHKKLRSAARRSVDTSVSHKGMKSEVSLPLFKAHTAMAKIIDEAGSIPEVGEADLRIMADFFIRMVLCGRTTSSSALLDNSFVFPPGVTRWRDVPVGHQISFRLNGTKAAHLSYVDRERDKRQLRSQADRRTTGSTACVTITRRRHPHHPQLDFFIIMDEYISRVSSSPRPLISTVVDYRDGQGPQAVELPPVFMGLSTSQAHRAKHLLPTTLNAALNRFLVKAGVIHQKQAQKCEHMRHSLVSWVLAFCNRHGITDAASASATTIRGDLYMRSMHSQSIAESTYHLHLHPDHQHRLQDLTDIRDLDTLLLLA